MNTTDISSQTRAFANFLNQQVKVYVAEEAAAIPGVIKDYDILGLVLEEATVSNGTPTSGTGIRSFYPWSAVQDVELGSISKKNAA